MNNTPSPTISRRFVIEASIAKDTYDAAHIPGARWVDFHRDLLLNGDDSSGGVIAPKQFAALMSRLGIAPDTTVVAYGDRHNSYAIRFFWTLDFYQHRGDALPGSARMDVEHADVIGAFERGEADRRVLHGRDQRQLPGEALTELFPLSKRGPGFLLRLAVIVAGQLLDRGNKDRRQHGRVLGKKRPQAGFG